MFLYERLFCNAFKAKAYDRSIFNPLYVILNPVRLIRDYLEEKRNGKFAISLSVFAVALDSFQFSMSIQTIYLPQTTKETRSHPENFNLPITLARELWP